MSVRGGMLQNVQALRAVAAISVVGVHFSRFDHAYLGEVLMFGQYGVDIFFVLSGFVMVLTTGRRPTRPVAFMLDRIVRIVPLYWLLTLIVYALTIVRPHLFGGTTSDPIGLLKSLCFIPFSKGPGGAFLPVLFPGWTLNYEMFFYALFAMSLFIRSRRVQVSLVVGILLVLVLAGYALPPRHDIFAFYTADIILEFAWGMGLGLLYPRLVTRPLPAVVGAGLTIAGFALLVFALPPLAVVAFRGIQVGAVAAMILLGVLTLELRDVVVRSPLLLLLGAASYALYLTHPFPMILVEKLAWYTGVVVPATVPMFLALALLCSLAVAVAVHRGIERPLDRAIRPLVRRITARKADVRVGPLAPLSQP